MPRRGGSSSRRRSAECTAAAPRRFERRLPLVGGRVYAGVLGARTSGGLGMPARKMTAGHGRETKQGYVSAEFEAPDVPDYVVAELRYEAPVAFTASRFTAPADAAQQADGLNQVLAKYAIRRIRSQFGLSPSDHPVAHPGGRRPAARAEPGPVRRSGNGLRLHPQRVRAGRPGAESRRAAARPGARPQCRRLEGVRRPAARAGGRRRAARPPGAATSSPRRATCTPRPTASGRRRSGASRGRRAPASRSVTSRATGTAATRICRPASRRSAGR